MSVREAERESANNSRVMGMRVSMAASLFLYLPPSLSLISSSDYADCPDAAAAADKRTNERTSFKYAEALSASRRPFASPSLSLPLPPSLSERFIDGWTVGRSGPSQRSGHRTEQKATLRCLARPATLEFVIRPACLPTCRSGRWGEEGEERGGISPEGERKGDGLWR